MFICWTCVSCVLLDTLEAGFMLLIDFYGELRASCWCSRNLNLRLRWFGMNSDFRSLDLGSLAGFPLSERTGYNLSYSLFPLSSRVIGDLSRVIGDFDFDWLRSRVLSLLPLKIVLLVSRGCSDLMLWTIFFTCSAIGFDFSCFLTY